MSEPDKKNPGESPDEGGKKQNPNPDHQDPTVDDGRNKTKDQMNETLNHPNKGDGKPEKGGDEKPKENPKHPPEHKDGAKDDHKDDGKGDHGGGDHGHDKETAKNDTIQELINRASTFTKAAPLSAEEKRIAGWVAGGTAAASTAFGLAQYVGNANSVAVVVNQLAAGAFGVVNNIPLIGSTVAQSISAAQNFIWSGQLFSTLGGGFATAGAIPAALAGLWAFGKLKSRITGEKYEGFLRPMYETLKTPVQLAVGAFKVPYRTLLHAPGWAMQKTYDASKYVKKEMIDPRTKWLKETVWEKNLSKVLSPSKLGVTAALFGLLFGGPAGGAIGYAGGNVVKSQKLLDSSAAAGSHGGAGGH